MLMVVDLGKKFIEVLCIQLNRKNVFANNKCGGLNFTRGLNKEITRFEFCFYFYVLFDSIHVHFMLRLLISSIFIIYILVTIQTNNFV